MNKKRILKLIIIFIVIAIISTMLGLYIGNTTIRLWVDKNILKRDIGEEDLPTIDIEDTSNIYSCAYNNYVATVANNTLTIYNQSAKAINKINVSIATPKFYSNGKYLLIADKGNSNLYLINNENLQWQKTIEGNITQITVNNNGAVGIVISGTTYKSVILMYDTAGNELFKTYLSTTTATDLALSEDSKYLSFAEINTSGTVIESKVKTISIEKAKNNPTESIINTYTTDSDTMILKLRYKKTKLVSYTDKGIHVYEDGNDEEISSINNKTRFADINLDGFICTVEENQTGILNTEYNIKIKNIETEKEILYDIKSTIKSIYCYKNIIAANTGNEVYFINTSGWLVKKFTSLQNIKDISIGDHTVAFIYKNSIEIMTI